MSDEIKNKAYLIASRLKNSGYDDEAIRARLDKEGIPEELIKQVVMNLNIQHRVDIAKHQEPFYNIALVNRDRYFPGNFINGFNTRSNLPPHRVNCKRNCCCSFL
jgi:hypothetical protein